MSVAGILQNGAMEHYNTELRLTNAGLVSLKSDKITILEVGFGTGLYILLTAIYAGPSGKKSHGKSG